MHYFLFTRTIALFLALSTFAPLRGTSATGVLSKRLVTLRKRRMRRGRNVIQTTSSSTKAPSPSTKAPSTIPSSAPTLACSDLEEVHFYAGTNKQGKHLYKTCEWLRSTKPIQKKKVCEMTEGNDGKDPAKDVCLATCGQCPTASPSPAPSTDGTSQPTACADIEGVLFYSGTNKQGKHMYRTCEWLRSTKPIQQKKVCEMTEGNNGKDPAKDVCRITCNTCPSDPGPATAAPSTAPSPGVTSICEDDDSSFFFAGLNSKKKPLFRKCPWLREQSDDDQENVCAITESKDGRGPAKDVCPQTCGTCS